MGQFLAFAEVLERKIRRQILMDQGNPESPAPSRETLAWETELPWTRFPRIKAPPLHPTRGKSAYGVKVRPRPPHSFDEKQRQAYCFFREHDPKLADNFTGTELKTSFRRLAKFLHPDAGGRAADFIRLKECHAVLLTVFKKR